MMLLRAWRGVLSLAKRDPSAPEGESTTSGMASVATEPEVAGERVTSDAHEVAQAVDAEGQAAGRYEVASAAQDVASAAQEVATSAAQGAEATQEAQEVASAAQTAAAAAAEAAAASAAEEVAASAAQVSQMATVAQAAEVAEATAAAAARGASATSRRIGRKELREKTDAFLEAQMEIALRSMTRNSYVNNQARLLIYLVAAALLLVAIYFLYRFGTDLNLSIGFRGYSTSTLIALSMPIIYAIAGACVCVGLATFIQSRNVKDFSNSLDQVSRLRREGTSSDTRSRALTQVLEETLLNAKQAFSMQLWISRALFLVGVLLFISFLLALAFNSENRALTGTSIASSIIAFAGAAFFNPEQRIGANLANVTKLEAILGGYTRQASVLEEYLFRTMDRYEEIGQPESANGMVLVGVDRLSEILDTAVRSISDHVESKQQDSPRERWLWEQLVSTQNGGGSNSGRSVVEDITKQNDTTNPKAT
jgi:uncharacterized protein (DUF486 family)